MIGIPSCIKQEELKSKKAHIETRGTAKEAVLEGDQRFTELIAASMYDTKPSHYTSMVSEEFKWVVKEKECFNVETGKVKNEIPAHELNQQIQE